MTFAQPFTDYEILDRVGAGAMGTVFKARQKRLSRIVALKVLRPSLARDTRYVERLRREARIVGGLNHPNIVTGYDLGEEGGYHFFVMEFVEGKSLRALLSEWGSFSEEQVLKVGTQVARALDHAFQRGVIHRDVKPANILIDEQGNVKLTDMGLAKGPADLTLTRDGATVGTPQYISPEQARNPQDVDVRSDLYSLGATLYHMATGQPPFRGDSLAEVITKVLHEVPVAPRVLDPSLSEGLSLVIRKLLTKNLRLRYQTPSELLLDLERVAQSKPPAVDEQRLLRGEEPGRGRMWPWFLGLGGAAAIAAGAFWYGITLRHEGAVTPSGDTFLLGLADSLAGVKSLRDQWQLLQAAGLRAPPGSVQGIEAQKQKVTLELARAVDAAMASLQGEQWPVTLGWLADPTRWPRLVDFERERISKALVDRTGFLAEQLPPSVDAASIAALRAAVDQAIAARDQSLLVQARSYLATMLPVRAAERSANGDFKAAEKIWREGLLTFFDGRQQPKLELVADAVRSIVVQAYEDQRKVAMRELDAQETAAATALRRDAEDFTAQLRDRLAAGGDPTVLLTDLYRLRDELGQSYPSASRFRADPWVDVKRGVDACERSLLVAAADIARRRQARTFDLAWRVFCAGDPEGAAGMLPAQVDGSKEPLVEQHRQALTAGAGVAAAMTRALLQRPPVPGHLRDSGLVVELTAAAQPGGVQLLASTAAGAPRVAHVTEFRFADLWREVMQVDPKALLGLPREQRELGQAVLAMVGDELADGGPLALAPTPFLRDEVYERIVRMRGDAGHAVTAQGEAMRRLTNAYDRARQLGDLRDLDAALLLFDRSPADSIAAEDRTNLQAIRQWREAERQRQQRLLDVQGGAPKGARIDVASEAGVLVATVQVEGAQIAAGASDNWAFNGRTVEFTGGGNAKWEGMVSGRLELGSGLPAAARRVDVAIDLVLPPSSVGQRSYVFDFRGVAVLLLVTADDKVRAAVIDGDPRQEDPVHAASLRALTAALDNGAHGRVIPGAVHRLQIRVDANANRTRGAARILLDQSELCLDEDVALDPMRPPNLTIYPMQALQMRAVQFAARGF